MPVLASLSLGDELDEDEANSTIGDDNCSVLTGPADEDDTDANDEDNDDDEDDEEEFEDIDE